jgi:hypothetical protein
LLQANILKQKEANIFKKDGIFIEAKDLWKAFLYNFKQYLAIFASMQVWILACIQIFASKYSPVWENVKLSWAHI